MSRHVLKWHSIAYDSYHGEPVEVGTFATQELLMEEVQRYAKGEKTPPYCEFGHDGLFVSEVVEEEEADQVLYVWRCPGCGVAGGEQHDAACLSRPCRECQHPVGSHLQSGCTLCGCVGSS